jgi:hypothetical protein
MMGIVGRHGDEEGRILGNGTDTRRQTTRDTCTSLRMAFCTSTVQRPTQQITNEKLSAQCAVRSPHHVLRDFRL